MGNASHVNHCPNRKNTGFFLCLSNVYFACIFQDQESRGEQFFVLQCNEEKKSIEKFVSVDLAVDNV
jgi:hypothetical protein